MNSQSTQKKKFVFILLLISGTLFLLPNFYSNNWKVVEPAYYDEWQTRYDRLVVARLVKNRQDGFFSSGGLLGLGDTPELNYFSATQRHQYNAYINNDFFYTYTLYKSNPGFQGLTYGILDTLINIPNEQKLLLYRGLTAILSALSLGLIFAFIVNEFSMLAGLSMLFFSAVSIWIVLPAGSIFWNLWAFFAPFVTALYLLANSKSMRQYPALKIYILLFITTLLRIILSGFDLITTGLIMTVTPFIFYGIYEKWDRKIFIERFTKTGVSLSLATITGLTIMSFQIASTDPEITNVFAYIANRFGHHFAGNSEYYTVGGIEATKIETIEIISKYLAVPAINIPWPGDDLQVLYSHIIMLFIFFTAIYFVINQNRTRHSRKGIALVATTWISLLAPLSWILIFKPHSIIHTHVNSMGWQMPFTLFGFALCGYVISDLFKRDTS